MSTFSLKREELRRGGEVGRSVLKPAVLSRTCALPTTSSSVTLSRTRPTGAEARDLGSEHQDQHVAHGDPHGDLADGGAAGGEIRARGLRAGTAGTAAAAAAAGRGSREREGGDGGVQGHAVAEPDDVAEQVEGQGQGQERE